MMKLEKRATLFAGENRLMWEREKHKDQKPGRNGKAGKSFGASNEGATAVEYSLVAFLIASVVVGGGSQTGQSLTDLFASIAGNISNSLSSSNNQSGLQDQGGSNDSVASSGGATAAGAVSSTGSAGSGSSVSAQADSGSTSGSASGADSASGSDNMNGASSASNSGDNNVTASSGQGSGTFQVSYGNVDIASISNMSDALNAAYQLQVDIQESNGALAHYRQLFWHETGQQALNDAKSAGSSMDLNTTFGNEYDALEALASSGVFGSFSEADWTQAVIRGMLAGDRIVLSTNYQG